MSTKNNPSGPPPYLMALSDLRIITHESSAVIWPRCRDRDDLEVWRCARSGVIFLRESSRSYTEGDHLSYYNEPERNTALQNCMEDDTRRAIQFRELGRNATWLDIGSGLGGFIAQVDRVCAEIIGVEPQGGLRQSANAAGLNVLSSTNEARSQNFDVVSLFHVFEHLSDPLAMLAEAKRCLKPGGTLIIEVPHARDLLLSFFDLPEFKDHTFWSEHLILHTRESLRSFLTAGGFKVKAISGFQRYPLANHLHWLARHVPGGHKHWAFMRSNELDTAYSSKLAELDANDTIIAIASV